MSFQRLKTEFKDFAELVLLPGIAAFLPWSISFKLFKRAAHWKWLYQAQCEAALCKARQKGWGGENEAHWIWVRRLVTLVDHADHYLGLSRSDRWLAKHMETHGRWPVQGVPLAFITFHWSAGYWGLRHLASHGHKPHALVASLNTNEYKGRYVMLKYAKSRNRNVANILRSPNLDIGSELKKVVQTVRANKTILGVVDVPVQHGQAGTSVYILGMKANVPKGLLRLITREQITVALYSTGLDTQTGKRFLNITQIDPTTDADSLSSQIFSNLNLLIQQEAPAWHFWSEADRFFDQTSNS